MLFYMNLKRRIEIMGTGKEDECKGRYYTAERQCDNFLPIPKELLFRSGRPW